MPVTLHVYPFPPLPGTAAQPAPAETMPAEQKKTNSKQAAPQSPMTCGNGAPPSIRAPRLGSKPSGPSYHLLMTSFVTYRPHNETGGG